MAGSDPVVRWFLRVAGRRRDGLALRTSDREVTYAQLARLAGGWQELIARSGLDDRPAPVMIAAADGIDLAACALAVEASGRPVVTVDPLIGPERAGRVAAGVGAAALAGNAPLEVPGLPRLRTDVGGRLDPVAAPPGTPYQIALTSGSTGEPRPIVIPGRPRRLRATERRLDEVRPEDRMGIALGATYPTLHNLFRGILIGGPCTIVDLRRTGARTFHALLGTHRITFLVALPTVIRELGRIQDPVADRPPLRLVRSVGETLRWSDVTAIRELSDRPVMVVNGYGTTETGTIALERIGPRVRARPDDGPVPVGRPIRGRSVWIDAGDGRAAPPGAEGELVVEGRFARSGAPIEPLPRGRGRYRTGDLAVRREDGRLELTGRVDRRLKRGGIRVDPGEVEAALRSLPAVVDAAVVRAVGDEALVAHVVVAGGSQDRTSAALLRAGLGHLVHPAAVPDRFALRTAPLPTLGSGKVDLRGLAGAPGTRDALES